MPQPEINISNHINPLILKPIIFSAQSDTKGLFFPDPNFVRKFDVVFEAAIFLFFTTIFDNYLLFNQINFSGYELKEFPLKFTPKKDVGMIYTKRDFVCVLKQNIG